MDLNRYHRQTLLPEIGKEGQRLLKEARVLCVGVGGLGSPATLYLAAAGVGTLGLIDSDTVDLTNLHRQILFETQDQGKPKVVRAKIKLQRLNPTINIETYQKALDTRHVEEIFSQYDLILDGTDNFDAKLLINDAAYKFKKPLIYTAISGFEGRLALFSDNNGSCYRCLFEDLPRTKIQNCAEAGVLGSVVGVMGSLQATIALQYIVSKANSKHPLFPRPGVLTLINLRGVPDFHSVVIPKKPDCPTCSLKPEQVELSQFRVAACKPVLTIVARDLIDLLSKPSNNTLLIDVREIKEWEAGHLHLAQHFALSRMEAGEMPSLSPYIENIVLYCQSGIRSLRAASLLIDRMAKGSKVSIRHLVGGLNAIDEPLFNLI